ncbi:MAG: NmrA family NAD(P)-binding protein [Deltaproteobacteria bacterium]|nr:NmrA family NAD(P)-binding protein [Deltaproteobacteria bacterium]
MLNLIFGGTGTVGSNVVRELLARGEKVRVVTRTNEHAQKLPAGVDTVIGDLTNPTTYASMFGDVDNVFLLNPVSMTELHEGLAGVIESQRAKVKKLVYLSVHHAENGVNVPHFASKVAIERAIKDSGLKYTILRPNNFFQNDIWFQDALIKASVYPQPYGDVGISRVDVRDIAECAAIVLTHTGHENKTYNLVGPKPINGNATAEIYSKVLGRKINYAGNDLNAWEKQALTMMPAWMVYDFKVMFRMFQEKGLLGTDTDVQLMTKLLGRAPRSFDTFVAEWTKTWK